MEPDLRVRLDAIIVLLGVIALCAVLLTWTVAFGDFWISLLLVILLAILLAGPVLDRMPFDETERQNRGETDTENGDRGNTE